MAKRKWFAMRGRGASEAEVLILSEIGYGGLTAGDFFASLSALGDVDKMTIRISSDGGDVSTGFAIFNMLASHPAKKTVRIEGLAASMASIIAMAADEVVMPSNAQMMIHNPWGAIVGESEQIASFAEGLKTMQDNMVAIYRGRTGLSSAKIRAMMDRETWLSAGRAKELGFADKVEKAGMANASASFNLDRFTKVPAAVGQFIKESTMTKKVKGSAATEFEADEVRSEAEIRDEVREQILAKAKDIRSLCALAGLSELADGYISEDKDVAEVIAALETAKAAKAKAKGGSQAELKPQHAAKPEGGSSHAEVDTAAVYTHWNSFGKRKAG